MGSRLRAGVSKKAKRWSGRDGCHAQVCLCVYAWVLYLILNPSSPECPEGLLFIHRKHLFSLTFPSLSCLSFSSPSMSILSFWSEVGRDFCGFALSQYVIVLTILVKSLWETRFTTEKMRMCLCTCVHCRILICVYTGIMKINFLLNMPHQGIVMTYFCFL